MDRITEALREGCKIGFQHARHNPDESLDEYLAEIDDLQSQLRALPTWKIRVLSGKGTWLDRLRLRMANGSS